MLWDVSSLSVVGKVLALLSSLLPIRTPSGLGPPDRLTSIRARRGSVSLQGLRA